MHIDPGLETYRFRLSLYNLSYVNRNILKDVQTLLITRFLSFLMRVLAGKKYSGL